jgi:GrpB-like predicted nucleotidyltransferase (UPF0157 family)
VSEEPIRLVPYDSTWPERFEAERAALEEAVGRWVLGGIHHIGSTAVPGMEAKPVIDIMAGVRDLEESRSCFEPLGRLEYVYFPYLPAERHWFCKPDPSRRTHHLHLVPADSPRFRDHLAFRDRLRADPEFARQYTELKRRLAARFERDREAYTEGKDDFIATALR